MRFIAVALAAAGFLARLATAQSGGVSLKIQVLRLPILEGTNFTMRCTNRSGTLDPNVTFVWEFPAIVTFQEHKFSENKGSVDIAGATRNNTGSYRCLIAGTNISATTKIDVFYFPKEVKMLTRSACRRLDNVLQVFIAEGDLVYLSCKTDSNPKIPWSWFRFNENLKAYHDDLNIKNATNGSIYTCKGNDEMHIMKYEESAIIFIEVPVSTPTIVTNGTTVLNVGDSVAMKCSHDNGTEQWYTWTSNDQKIVEGSDRHILSDGGASLLVQNAQEGDGSKYQCTVQNHLGGKSSEVLEIKITHTPKWPFYYWLLIAVASLIVLAAIVKGTKDGWFKCKKTKSYDLIKQIKKKSKDSPKPESV